MSEKPAVELVLNKEKQVLKAHYFTPAEAEITPHAQSHLPHQPIPIDSFSLDNDESSNTKKISNFVQLDGFYLLGSSNQGMPDDVHQVLLADKKITSVVADDLTYFNELMFLDVSENRVTLEPFGAIPNLIELRISCNYIKSIGVLLGFKRLQYLDLSYNLLSIECVKNLTVLPNLKELDLCGNDLKILPKDMSKFTYLEKIVLEYNKFENNLSIFSSLSTIPNLRHACLANNFLSKISLPYYNGADKDAFSVLELLDISFNFFGTEEDISPILNFPRLTTLMLYGNPLLGPTGEDPMMVYIEDTVDAALAYKQSIHGSDIDFITEIPRKRHLKKNQPIGRQAHYRNFSLTQVNEDPDNKTSREWKMQGTRTLFAELMSLNKNHTLELLHETHRHHHHTLSASSPTQSPGYHDPSFSTATATHKDNTFLTFVNITGEGSHKPSPHHSKHRFIADATNLVADNVMKNVAKDLGLLNSAEILLMRDLATIRTKSDSNISEVPRPESKSPFGMSALKSLYMSHNEPFSLSVPSSPVKNQHNLEQYGRNSPQLKPAISTDEGVPSNLLAGTIMNGSNNGVAPAALTTAMRSLNLVLKFPLTDYSEERDANEKGTNKIYNRTTLCSINRQVVPQQLRLSKSGNYSTEEKDKGFSKHSVGNEKSTGNGRKGVVDSNHQRIESRLQTLQRIDEVLDGLNSQSEVILKRAERDSKGADVRVLKRFIGKPKDGIAALQSISQAINKEFI